ncbi:hypothetical protein AVEN_245143-1, partial [Araneus ventricosus]
KICACRKLTKRHVEVSGLKKMNVKLAAQVLSHSVAAALNLYVGREDFDSKASRLLRLSIIWIKYLTA